MWSDDDLDALRRATAVTDAAKKQLLKFTRELIAKTQKEFRREKKVAEAREAADQDLVSARAGLLQDSTSEAILRV